jgi:hypothetical protein
VLTRRWSSFNREVTNREFAALPQRDYADLTQAMKAYRQDIGAGYELKNYGGGLMMVKSSSGTQGRCLFFTIREEAGVEVLTALLIYKKETQEVPRRIEETARERMEGAR